MEEGEVGIGMGLLGGVTGGMIVVTKSAISLSSMIVESKSEVEIICSNNVQQHTFFGVVA